MKNKYDDKKLKEYEVKILDYFVSICNENKLSYFLAYGTLLGAVRHMGFIPWDDDIDVYMPAVDYYKLKEIMKRNPDKQYFYQSLETEKYYNLTFAKIRMNGTEAIEKKNQYEKMHKGIYIDIFPLLPFPDKTKDQKKFLFKLRMLNLLITADSVDKTRYSSYGKIGKSLSNFLKFIPRRIRNLVAEWLLKSIAFYKGEFHNYFDVDEKIFSKEFFNDNTSLVFEGKSYNVPLNYDDYLTTMYGEYMILPKKENQVSHSFVKVSFGEENSNHGK